MRCAATSICEGFCFFFFPISYSSPSSSLFRISHCQPPSFLCTDNPCSNPSPASRLRPHLIHPTRRRRMVFSQEVAKLPPRSASNNKLAAKLFASSTLSSSRSAAPDVCTFSCTAFDHFSSTFSQPAVMIFSKELFHKRVSGEWTKNLLLVQIENLQSGPTARN